MTAAIRVLTPGLLRLFRIWAGLVISRLAFRSAARSIRSGYARPTYWLAIRRRPVPRSRLCGSDTGGRGAGSAAVVCRRLGRHRDFAACESVTGQRIDSMRSVRLRRGEVVRIGALSGGAVLYIGVEGGFDIEPVLGSVSTYMRGAIGGWQGRALIAGDRLPLRLSEASDADDCQFDHLDLSPPDRFRVIVGPQNDYFSDAAMASFFDSRLRDRHRCRPHGHAAVGSAARTLPAAQFHLGRHRAGLDPGARQRPADRAAGRSPDRRRLSQNRNRDFGRFAGARPHADRRDLRFAPVTVAEAEAARRKLVAQNRIAARPGWCRSIGRMPISRRGCSAAT